MNKIYNEKIVSNIPVAEDIYSLEITSSDEVLNEFIPGQFAHIEIPDSPDLTLRRPISIHSINYKEKTVQLIYAIVGKGTERLSELCIDDRLNILMPLGNGFKINDGDENIVLIGGGIGCAPLRSVIDKYPDRNYTLFLGFRTKNQIFLDEKKAACELYLSTEDGSIGGKGFITDFLEEYLKKTTPDLILGCGPVSFFKSLKRIISNTDIKTQASLEQRMGCGTGGCAVCVCQINGKYRKVCSEGPVFGLREVDFDD